MRPVNHRPPTARAACVRRILVNASYRQFRRRPPVEETRAVPEGSLADPAAAADQRSDLMAALRELGPRQRAVIVLRYWADLNDARVAALLGCSEGTVRSQGHQIGYTPRRPSSPRTARSSPGRG
jgi:RNA polymerase sigma factor (sigma-70 family)